MLRFKQRFLNDGVIRGFLTVLKDLAPLTLNPCWNYFTVIGLEAIMMHDFLMS